ncbi:MAG: MMPL family transporter [Tannerella sp.]|jgi:predicted RND superfamily exporter protein|nr:MMPL family transporter [Tannerella sp.]
MISLYRFFQKHKILLYGLLVSSSLLFIYLGSKVEYEEDISKLLPSTQAGSAEKLVFENLKVKDKIFLLFVSRSDTVDADMLADKCDAFVETLLLKDTVAQDIQNILYKIDDELIQSGIEFVFDHVPVFIDTAMYPQIEALLTKEAIEQQMAANYDLIISPRGMAFRDMVRQDPVGLRNLFTGNAASVSEMFGGNYTMVYRHFFTPDTAAGIAFLSPNFKAFDSKSGIRLVETIEETIAAFKIDHPEVEVLFHGAPVQSVFNSRQIKKDLVFTLGISVLFICIVIGLCFKNKSTLWMLLGPVVYGTFFSLACVSLIKGSMSLLAVGIGAIVLGVALSYCLHVLTHYKYVNDPERVLRDQAAPVFLGCLTTVGAFVGLLFTKSALLQDFGIFASLALIGTAVFCLIFLPHFFRPEKNKRSDKAFAWLEKINTFPLDKQKWLLIGIAAICAVCFHTRSRVTFDSDLKNIGYHEPQIVRSSALLAEKTAQGNASVFYAATSHDLDTALLLNRQMTVLLDSMHRDGTVKGLSKAAALFPAKSEQISRIQYWRRFWTPERMEEVRNRLSAAGERYHFKAETFDPFFEILANDDQPVDMYHAGIIPDGLRSNIIEYTDSTCMVFTSVQMPEDQKQHVSQAIAAHPHWIVIDPFFYTSDMVRVMNDDFNTVLHISSGFVFIVLFLAYRNILRAILAFIPMGLSWFVVLGVMGIFGLQFNLINIVISTFIFGIGVDYSIYVMDGLLAGTRRNGSKLLMYHKTAIFFSAAVMITGVGSLVLATHPAMQSVGLTTLIGMTSTVLITYTLQPFLFNFLSRNRYTGKLFAGK